MSGAEEGTFSGRLWVVCPVYLDVESLMMLRERLLAVTGRSVSPSRTTYVAVDDTAGLDPEIDRLRALPDVKVVQPPFNVGHQRAIVYALRSASVEMADTDLVVTMDADGQDKPEDVPRLLGSLLDDPSNLHRVVLALRASRKEAPSFTALYFFFRVLFRALTGVSVRTGNFAAFRGWTARRVLRHPYFDLCYSSTLVSLNLQAQYVPCDRGPRFAGASRMNLSRLLIHGMRMLMPFTDRIAIRSLVLFTGVFALGLVTSAVILLVRFFTNLAIPGWATTTLLLVLVLSFLAVGNFVVLFAVFSQSRGISLANLEREKNGGA
jgi:hypothetical protein